MLKKTLKLTLVVACATVLATLVACRSQTGNDIQAEAKCYDPHTIVGGKSLRVPCPEPGWQLDAPKNFPGDKTAVTQALISPHDGRTKAEPEREKL